MSHGEWNGLLIILTITWTVRRYDCCEAVNSMRWSTHYKATQVSSWIFTSCQPHSVTSGLITHYIKIPSHQFRTQVTRSRADSCTTALDAPQSTADAIKWKKVNKRWKQQQIKNIIKRRRRKKTGRAQIHDHAAAACSVCLWKAHTHTHTQTHTQKGVGGEGGTHAGPSTNNTEFHILSSMISNSRSKLRRKKTSK